MMKKLLALLLAVLMACSVFAGCTKTQEVWVSDDDTSVSDPNDDDNNDDDNNDDDNQDDKGDNQDGKTTKSKKTRTPKTKTKKGTTTTTRRKGGKVTGNKNGLTYTPIADAGADYNVKGTVRIAVDTVRPTDYDAMFDVMYQLFKGVTIELDYWAHTNGDNGLEYMTTRFQTGTAADIIWDEAGFVPLYAANGWIVPLTKKIAADPEAKNYPANLKSSYTFGGEVYAAPHQATIEVELVNNDLLAQLGGKMPSTNWTWSDYEKLLELGADGLNRGICVGIKNLFSTHTRYGWYEAAQVDRNHGANGYNYKTQQIDDKYWVDGAAKFRELRIRKTGLEGWYASVQKDSSGTSMLSSKLGVDNQDTLFLQGKALVEDSLTVYTDQMADVKFKYTMLPTPNTNGNLMVHIDHCMITTNCKPENLDAAFQLLRFMTYSTNGNLARLTMYEDSQKGKYNLNSRLFFPTSSSAQVAAKFNALPVATATDKYIYKNIPNSSRYDTFKIVYNWNEDVAATIGSSMNDVTDGLKEASSMREPIAKFNAQHKKTMSEFSSKLAKAQATVKKKYPTL